MVIKVKLDPWQKKFLETKGDKILCTGRQVGKTEICAMDACEYAIKPDNKHPILITAPTERQARLLFDKCIGYLLENHTNKVIMKGVKRPTKSKIELVNGMVIHCLPTGQYGLGIRGMTVGRSYEDENSRTPPEIEASIAPMVLTTGGARIKLSTPFGATGEFYNTWINKDGAYDSYTRFSVTTEKVIEERPICETWSIHQKEGALKLIRQAKARMSNMQYQQEFLGEFQEDLHRWFSDKWIQEVCTAVRPENINPEADYFMGCDIARMGEDAGTYEIFRRTQNQMVHVENIVTHKKLTTETEAMMRSLVDKYNLRKFYIDAGSGSLGVSIFDHLIAEPKLRNKVIAINNAKRVTGYKEGEAQYTKLTKEDLYDNLRALGEQKRVKLLDDEEVIWSLQSVQYEYVKKEGQPTKLRIFSDDNHIVEGIIRGVQGIKERIKKFRIGYI